MNAFSFQTQYDGRMFNLNITCGDNYPEMPPDVRFVSKIAMNCVDKNGRVSTPPPGAAEFLACSVFSRKEFKIIRVATPQVKREFARSFFKALKTGNLPNIIKNTGIYFRHGNFIVLS